MRHIVPVLVLAAQTSAGLWIEQVETAGDVGWATNLVVDAAGNVHAGAVRSGAASWYARRDVATGSWTVDRSVDAYFRDVAVSPAGQPNLMVGSLQLLRHNGGTWQSEDLPAVAGVDARILYGPDGFARVAYVDPATRSLIHLKQRPGGAGWDSTTIIAGVQNFQFNNAEFNFVLDGNGDSHFTFKHENLGLRHATLSAGGVSIRNIFRIGQSLAFDPQGNMHLAWASDDEPYVFHGVLDTLGNWSMHPVDDLRRFGSVPTGVDGIDLAVNDSGDIAIGYLVNLVGSPDRAILATGRGAEFDLRTITSWEDSVTYPEDISIAYVGDSVHMLWTQDDRNAYYASVNIPAPASLLLLAAAAASWRRRS